MAKVWQFLTILSGLSILLAIFGLDTAGNLILTAVGYNPTTGVFAYSTSSLWNALMGTGGIFTLMVVGGIVYGAITGNTADSTIRASLAGALILFIGDIVKIMGFVSGGAVFGAVELSWVGLLIALVYVPLVVGYFIALVMFWGGNDI